jgi:hypothetical protein
MSAEQWQCWDEDVPLDICLDNMGIGRDIAQWVTLLFMFFCLGLVLLAGEVPIGGVRIFTPQKEQNYVNKRGQTKEYQYASGTAR